MRVIVGIAGKARTGKDTVADCLVKHHGFTRYAFADPIREAAKNILMLDELDLNGKGKEATLDWVDTSYREFAQQLGTEFVRSMIDQDFWFKRAERWLEMHKPERLVIPDVRFANEAEWIRQQHSVDCLAFVLHIRRDSAYQVNQHISECGVEPAPDEAVLMNNGDIDHLERRINDIFSILR